MRHWMHRCARRARGETNTQEVDVHAALLAAVESAEVVHELPMSPVIYGVVAFGALLALLGSAYAFRSVGTRH